MSGAGVLIMDPDTGKEFRRISKYLQEGTNNQAEYKAAVIAMDIAGYYGSHLTLFTDSLLLVKQYEGTYKVRNPVLKEMLKGMKNTAKDYESFNIYHIPREENEVADALANRAIDQELRTKSREGQ